MSSDFTKRLLVKNPRIKKNLVKFIEHKEKSQENLEVQGKVLWITRDDQEKRAEIIMGIYWTLDTHWEMIANG